MHAEGGIDLEGMKQIILDEEIVCPISGTRNWTDVRQFNLMFKTEMGAAAAANCIPRNVSLSILLLILRIH